MLDRRIASSAVRVSAGAMGGRGRLRIASRVQRALSPALAAVMWVAAGAGCHDPECEGARLELASKWETLRDTATSRRQIPEASGLSPSEAQERIRVWTIIEERAELVRSSFETAQVTWPSAEKARADLAEAFKPLASNDDPMTRGFAITLNDADQQMASFRKSCR